MSRCAYCRQKKECVLGNVSTKHLHEKRVEAALHPHKKMTGHQGKAMLSLCQECRTKTGD